MFKFYKDQSGQTLTQEALVITIIVIVFVATIILLGPRIVEAIVTFLGKIF